MLEHGHNLLLVVAAFAVAVMAGFTGLSLTQGASSMSVARRKTAVSMSAVALGSGIWSMHFVAMLGMTLPVPFHYDALVTLISALVAILLTGVALLLVHFGDRTAPRITLAGVCVALGILAMHYVGMSGIEDVEPVYTWQGVTVAVFASLALCIASFWISYGERTSRNILFGTLVFGIAVFAVHFVAMAGTHFVQSDGPTSEGLWLSNEVLAFAVTISSFLISGAFLLAGVSFVGQAENVPDTEPSVDEFAPEVQPQTVGVQGSAGPIRLPYERDGRTHFVPDNEIRAIRAEGRYTFLYHPLGRLFCPLAISEVEKKLASSTFVKCHRSYLINKEHVISFERKKDNGVVYFDGEAHIEKAPVSRSFLKDIRATLGL